MRIMPPNSAMSVRWIDRTIGYASTDSLKSERNLMLSRDWAMDIIQGSQ